MQIEPFKLAANNQQSIRKVKRPYAYNSEDEEDNGSYEDDDDFEIDSTALKGILNNTGITVLSYYHNYSVHVCFD